MQEILRFPNKTVIELDNLINLFLAAFCHSKYDGSEDGGHEERGYGEQVYMRNGDGWLGMGIDCEIGCLHEGVISG